MKMRSLKRTYHRVPALWTERSPRISKQRWPAKQVCRATQCSVNQTRWRCCATPVSL